MNVLDYGEVRLLGSMADDLDVVGSARVSTGTDPAQASKGEQSDQRLIKFLMTNGHGSPFEHSVFRFYVKAPLFVFREWQRHRIGSFNEQSGRYSEFQPEFYVPKHARVPDPDNKQSSVIYEPLGPVTHTSSRITAVPRKIERASFQAYEQYRDLLALGVAREMARMVLPLNMYSAMWWTVNARSLMNFLMLRNAPTAQYEIQVYAKAIESMFASTMPMTHAAFEAAGRRAP